MGKILLIFLISATGASLLVAPWATALAYVSNSLIQPQYLWPWIFEGVPVFKITAIFSLFAFLILLAKREIDLSIYKSKQNIFLFALWVWLHISHILSPYKGSAVSVSPEIVLDTINSIMMMYLILLPLCQNRVTLKLLCYVFIIAGCYYVYWANSAYFGQEWHRFVNGRLVGPPDSPYADANVLSVLIVMCIPFIIFLFFMTKRKIIKIVVVLVVAMAWHAMILFSSRAALLASVISLLAVAYIIKNAKVNFLVGLAFFLFLVYQGAMLLDRTTETIELAQSYGQEPINPRLVSWEAGLKLIPIYPVFGAGVQMFEAAADNHFPGKTPHVAHNTFLNFSVNAGLPAGILFISLIWLAWARLKEARSYQESLTDLDYYALVSSSISIIGFFICSVFLDLIVYEPFYIALIINFTSYLRLSKKYCSG